MKIKKIISVTLIQRPQEEHESFFTKLEERISAIQDNGNEAVLHFNSSEAGLSVLVEEVTYTKKSKPRDLPHSGLAKSSIAVF